ncbi:MAG: isoprenylcysteine carboxylmethyltransferase family protein [bacterium]
MKEISYIGFRYRALFPIPFAIITIIWAKPTIISLLLGSILVLIGLIIRVVCLGYLGVKSRDEVPNIANLITSGPYQYSRNPVYIANTLIAIGLAIFSFGGYGLNISVLVGLLTATIYFLFYNFLVIPAEEEFLEKKFGQEYIEYKNQVPRWFINFKKIPSKGRFRMTPVLRTEYWTWLIVLGMYIIILLRGRIIKI